MRDEGQSTVELDIELRAELAEELSADLAEAAEGVRVGPVPTAAVMAGGRRRRLRRRSVVTALALAVLLPAGGLTVAVATGGEETGSRGGVAAQPAAPGVFTPVTGTVGTVKLPNGTTKKIEVTVYGAPGTATVMFKQLDFARERGDLWSKLPEDMLVPAPSRQPFAHMWFSVAFVEGDKREPLPMGPISLHQTGSLHISPVDRTMGVGIAPRGSSVEVDWRKGQKARPRLVSVPGVDAVKFYIVAIPENVVNLQPIITFHNQEGEAIPTIPQS
ncbi:hypothetical protein ACIHCQ_42895 [Streptomyces sp. NPDC052236]|uniref:hypothetical protein n=1 Tax=Streptomyces sp. NPDC052236 TaxID=3365686 RepID=UPI0037D76AD3